MAELLNQGSLSGSMVTCKKCSENPATLKIRSEEVCRYACLCPAQLDVINIEKGSVSLNMSITKL